jgi:hypothetical protein
VDQATSDRPVTRMPPPEDGSSNGLADQVRQVEQARARLGEDLEQLNYEVRAEMGMKVEKIAWKLAMLGSAAVAVFGTQKALTMVWKKVQKADPPTNPANPSTGWGEAIGWTVASAIGAAVAKLVAARAAAAGWEKATGELPPNLER